VFGPVLRQQAECWRVTGRVPTQMRSAAPFTSRLLGSRRSRAQYPQHHVFSAYGMGKVLERRATSGQFSGSWVFAADRSA
jgi:hypothetical protein